jgi:hypothetical protein
MLTGDHTTTATNRTKAGERKNGRKQESCSRAGAGNSVRRDKAEVKWPMVGVKLCEGCHWCSRRSRQMPEKACNVVRTWWAGGHLRTLSGPAAMQEMDSTYHLTIQGLFSGALLLTDDPFINNIDTARLGLTQKGQNPKWTRETKADP